MSAAGRCEVWCQSPEGFECRLEMPVSGVDGMVALLGELEAAGFAPRQQKPKSTARSQPTEHSTPPWCERHDCRFKLYRKNDKTWWAHLIEETGEWCNYRTPSREF